MTEWDSSKQTRAEAREINALLRGSINASQTVISGNILARVMGVSGRTGVRGIFYCLLDVLDVLDVLDTI